MINNFLHLGMNDESDSTYQINKQLVRLMISSIGDEV